jgi:hypothetical protein
MRGKGGTSGALQVNVVSLNEDNPCCCCCCQSPSLARWTSRGAANFVRRKEATRPVQVPLCIIIKQHILLPFFYFSFEQVDIESKKGAYMPAL